MAEEQELYVKAEKPSRWTFKNYFKAIKHFKWWVVGATALCTALGFVSFKFVLNPLKEELSANFSYTLAGTVDNDGTYHLLDGTLFHPYDVISYDNLKATKESKKDYASLNIDKIYKESSITVVKVLTDNGDETKSISYRISAKSSDFPKKEVGEEFLYDLINSPLSISAKAIETYKINTYVTDNFDELAFDQEIGQLSKQYSMISSVYQTLQQKFGSSTLVEGKPLYEYTNGFASKYKVGSSNLADALSGQLLSNHFVKYEKGKETEKISEIDAYCESLVKVRETKLNDYARYKESLDLLNSSQSINISDTEFIKLITEYTLQLNSLKESINQAETQLEYYGWEDSGSGYVPNDSKGVRGELIKKDSSWVKANDDFGKAVSDAKDSLVEDSESASKASRYLYSTYMNKVVLIDSAYVVSSGTISAFIGLIAGLALGFIASSLVCTAVFINKEEK